MNSSHVISLPNIRQHLKVVQKYVLSLIAKALLMCFGFYCVDKTDTLRSWWSHCYIPSFRQTALGRWTQAWRPLKKSRILLFMYLILIYNTPVWHLLCRCRGPIAVRRPLNSPGIIWYDTPHLCIFLTANIVQICHLSSMLVTCCCHCALCVFLLLVWQLTYQCHQWLWCGGWHWHSWPCRFSLAVALHYYISLPYYIIQRFDAVGWVSGRASGP